MAVAVSPTLLALVDVCDPPPPMIPIARQFLPSLGGTEYPAAGNWPTRSATPRILLWRASCIAIQIVCCSRWCRACPVYCRFLFFRRETIGPGKDNCAVEGEFRSGAGLLSRIIPKSGKVIPDRRRSLHPQSAPHCRKSPAGLPRFPMSKVIRLAIAGVPVVDPDRVSDTLVAAAACAGRHHLCRRSRQFTPREFSSDARAAIAPAGRWRHPGWSASRVLLKRRERQGRNPWPV